MTRKSKFCALALLAGGLAQAASVSASLTVTAAGTLSGTSVSATGTATMTNVYSGAATFTGTLPITSIDTSGNINGTFTISPSTGGTLTGTLKIGATLFESLLEGSSNATGTGSAAITGGTGAYAGYTGTFASLTGTGTPTGTTTFNVSISGPGTVVTSGGGGTTTPTPTITAVQDAGSYTSNIAEGSIFVVKGSNLSGSGYSATSFPLPTTSGGVSISLTHTTGGTAISAYIVYLYNQSGVNQLAAILPSTAAAGSYNLTVTNSGATSAGFPVTVVASKPGLITQDSSGTGLAVIQNYVSASELDVDRFTTGAVGGVTISPAKPGQALIAWGTGLGPYAGPDNQAAVATNLVGNGVNIQVIVGGISITPFYAGRAPGLAGADQIDFYLPSSIPTGCTVSFQVSVNGIVSNATFLSIAPSSSSSACVAPGLTTSQLQSLDQGGTITSGGFELTNISASIAAAGGTASEKIGAIAGSFSQINGFQLASSSVVTSQPGACQVVQTSAANTSSVVTSSGGTQLDAGAITLNGPTGSGITNAALTETADLYNLALTETVSGLPAGVTLPGIPGASIVAGTYTLKGAGGKDVGPFNTSITLGTPLTITNGLPTVVNRSAGLTLNWTGGNATDTVEIFGLSGATANTTEFYCVTTAGPGSFTVPASILSQLPAATTAAITAGTATGLLGVFSSPTPASGNGQFTASLTAGGSVIGNFLALLGIEATASYQ